MMIVFTTGCFRLASSTVAYCRQIETSFHHLWSSWWSPRGSDHHYDHHDQIMTTRWRKTLFICSLVTITFIIIHPNPPCLPPSPYPSYQMNPHLSTTHPPIPVTRVWDIQIEIISTHPPACCSFEPLSHNSYTPQTAKFNITTILFIPSSLSS